MTTYEFYRGIHGGTADEAAFASSVSAAENLLRSLLFPAVPEEFAGGRADAFCRAVCLQVDFDLAGGGAADGARIRSETLGDRSVTYELDGRRTVTRVKGAAAAPQAVMLLENSGCLSRWV